MNKNKLFYVIHPNPELDCIISEIMSGDIDNILSGITYYDEMSQVFSGKIQIISNEHLKNQNILFIFYKKDEEILFRLNDTKFFYGGNKNTIDSGVIIHNHEYGIVRLSKNTINIRTLVKRLEEIVNILKNLEIKVVKV